MSYYRSARPAPAIPKYGYHPKAWPHGGPTSDGRAHHREVPVLAQIGRGGMGTVYKAVDETLDRDVAIKVLNADVLEPESIERFRREAMTLARLNHPRIAAIHELTRDGHDLLMVMEFLDGRNLRAPHRAQSVRCRCRAPCRSACRCWKRSSTRTGAGVVHRDLKPANIIITPIRRPEDDGLRHRARAGQRTPHEHGFMVGTPAYMSPEQVRGEEVDPRMDLYAIAVVLYRLLTHHLPFQGDTAIAMIHSQLSNPPTPAKEFRADLPEWVLSVLTRGLAKIAAERYQTASEFRGALENGITGRLPIPAPSQEDLDITVGPMLTPPSMRVPSVTASGRQVIPPAASGQQPIPSTPSEQVRIPTAQAPMPTASAPIPTASVRIPTATSPFPPMPPAKTEATVTLRAPHLAGAAVLVVLLIIGVTILAMVALQRGGDSAPAETNTAASTDPAPGSTPPAATPDALATAAATTPASAVTAPATPPAPTPATAPVTTPVTTPPAASRPPANPDGSAGARGESGRRGAPPTTALPATATGSTAAPVGPAPKPIPAAADAPTENFGIVRTVIADGSRSREVESLLSLEPGVLITRNRNDGSIVRSLPYRDILAATYNRARRPKGQAIPGAAPVPENFAGGGVFGNARHWLALQTTNDFLVIRLEDRNVVGALSALEARTGLTISRTQDD